MFYVRLKLTLDPNWTYLVFLFFLVYFLYVHTIGSYRVSKMFTFYFDTTKSWIMVMEHQHYNDQFVRIRRMIKKWLIRNNTTSLVLIRTICLNPRDGYV